MKSNFISQKKKQLLKKWRDDEVKIIGVIGSQGTGKSTIMSHLSSQKLEENVFEIQSKEKRLKSIHQTEGLEIFFNENQKFILIDSQAIQSASILQRMLEKKEKENSNNFSNNYSAIQTEHYSQSLKIVMFLLSICHIIILMNQNNNIDFELLKLIRSCQMLNNSDSITSNSTSSNHPLKNKFLPIFISLHNKSNPSSPQQQTYLANACKHILKKDLIDLEKADSKFEINHFENQSNQMQQEFFKKETQFENTIFFQFIPHQHSNQYFESICSLENLVIRLCKSIHGITLKEWLKTINKEYNSIQNSQQLFKFLQTSELDF